MDDEYLIYGETLETLADAIRSVANDTTKRDPHEMAAYILANLVKPTTRQAAKTYTPSTSNQTIPAGTFLTGAATIQGDADWVESNIKKGVNMWGKTGTLDGIFGTPGTFYGFTKVKSGSFTITQVSTTNYQVTHSLGIAPKLVACISDGTFTTSDSGSSSTRNLVGFMGMQTATETNLSANTSPASGMYMIARLQTSGWQYNTAVYGSGATQATYSSSSKNTMLSANNDADFYVTSTYINISTNSTVLRKGTYKWIAMA